MVVLRGSTAISIMTLYNETVSSIHAPRITTVTLYVYVHCTACFLGQVLDSLIVDYAELCYMFCMCAILAIKSTKNSS